MLYGNYIISVGVLSMMGYQVEAAFSAVCRTTSTIRSPQYVIEQLRLLGVEITEAVLSMIEGEVWGINTETKKAQVLPVALDGLVIEDTVEVEEAGHGDGQ